MNKLNIKKLITTFGLSFALLIVNVTPVFANGAGELAHERYDASTGNPSSTSTGTSSGVSGGTSSGKSTSTSKAKITYKTVYVPPVAVNWNTVNDYINRYHGNMAADSKVGNATGSYIVNVKQESTYTKTVRYRDENNNVAYSKITYITPRIIVDFRFNGTTKDIRKNYNTPYYNWRLVSGPTNGLAKNAWTTPGTISTVSYYNVGDYTISSVPHQTWDTYQRDTFTAFVKSFYTGQAQTILDSKLYAYDTFVTKSEGDDMNNLKTYNMKIATQDLNQVVTVHDMNTSVQYEAVPKMIQ